MMKREINTSRTGNHKKRNRFGKKWLWLFLLLVLVGILAGGVLARYRADNQKQEEMKSSDFHITSDLLEEEGAFYDVTDWRSGIDILLYNYEKENVALIAGDDISYTVNVDGKWVCSDPNKGVFKKSKDRTSQTIHLTPGKARKRWDDNTAILPMWGAVAVEICLGGKRQKTGMVECHWQSITQASDGSRVRGTG